MAISSATAWVLAFNHMWDWGAGGWVFGIFMMIFWVAVIALVVYLVIHAYTHGSHAAPTPPVGPAGPPPGEPMDIARRRFAAGEISKEQLEEIEKTLKGSG